MTPKTDDTLADQPGQAGDFRELMYEKMRQAIRVTLVTLMEEEVAAFVGAARYERTDKRQDHRNGSYPRDLGTNVGPMEDLPIPRTRKGFKTQVFERYQRRQAELDAAICGMFVQGVSQQRVGEVVESLTGIEPSPSTVSRVFHTLEDEYRAWKSQLLDAEYKYAFADGTYFTVIYDHEGHKMPVLAIVGITLKGERQVLGFSVGDRENQNAWEEALADLRRRGVKKVDLWITDGNQAMINAIQNKFPDAQRQRCIKHKMDNVLGYIPNKQQEKVEPELKAIFYQDNREKADQVASAFIEKYQATYPSAVDCLKRDLEVCLTFYSFPPQHWKTIRTTNIIERLFNEVKKRSHKMAAAFRNENSCLLMFYAVIRSLTFKNIPMSAK